MPARLAACFVRGELHRAGNDTPPDLMRKSRERKRPVAAAGPTRATTVVASACCGHRRLVLIPDAHRRRRRFPLGWRLRALACPAAATAAKRRTTVEPTSDLPKRDRDAALN